MVASAEEAESSASSASSDRPSAVLSFVALPRTPRAGLMSGEIIFRISLWFIYTGIYIYIIYIILYIYMIMIIILVVIQVLEVLQQS